MVPPAISAVLAILGSLLGPGASAQPAAPYAPYADPPFAAQCQWHSFGEGEIPPLGLLGQDPLCVEYSKRDITVSNGGAVRFLLAERPDGVVTCHCGQCRRFHGHIGAYITVPRDTVTFDADATLSWYRSSNFAERGFCGRCGSSLFWKGDGSDYTSIMAGAFDRPTGLKIGVHIFCADKGDYYEIDDGVPQFPQAR